MNTLLSAKETSLQMVQVRFEVKSFCNIMSSDISVFSNENYFHYFLPECVGI